MDGIIMDGCASKKNTHKEDSLMICHFTLNLFLRVLFFRV
jgi:hypothetical protein